VRAITNGTTTTEGVWSALDAATGQIIWQVTPLNKGGTSGPVTTANGVVFGCSLDSLGYMYALNAATGEMLWRYPSGGSCLSGARGIVYWGSASSKGDKGEYRCLTCDEVLDVFDGTFEVLIRLTIPPVLPP
jgi:outer membrane protein assembly factor BamB